MLTNTVALAGTELGVPESRDAIVGGLITVKVGLENRRRLREPRRVAKMKRPPSRN